MTQWAGSSRVRNRKQEVISQDDLNSLGWGVHQENNTYIVPGGVCLWCVGVMRTSKALEMQSLETRPTAFILYMYVWVGCLYAYKT